MIMKNYTYASLLALLLLVSTTWVAAQNVLVNTTKKYNNITQIEVESGWLDVSYQGGEGTEVSVEAYLESNISDQDIVFVTVGDVLKVSYKRSGEKYNWNGKNKGYLKITGPKSMQVSVRGSSGEINLTNLASENTVLQLTSGTVAAAQIKGNLTLTSTSGTLKATGIEGNVEARLTSGNAFLENISGKVSYESTSGSLDARDIDGELNVRLTSGNAKIENAKQLGKLSFTSGNVRAINSGLGANTQLTGTSGNFTIQTTSDLKAYNYSLRAASGNLRVGGSSGTKSLELNNNAANTVRGNITSGNMTITN
jgi:lia operon protein LiaG